LLDSGFVGHWSGGYLTSNVVLEANGEPIGARYALLQGRNSRVLAFGFLYNFVDNCKMTIVERVQVVVQQEWFRSALVEEHFDAILVLAHMDCVDPLVFAILESIRTIVGSEMPIQFLTGHSHRRCFEATDPASSSMEAGRFLDTVGFVSFPSIEPTRLRFQTTRASSSFNTLSYKLVSKGYRTLLDSETLKTCQRAKEEGLHQLFEAVTVNFT
jgi:2',3'-cyclic-nucleotide 2'-phosphodiesterase (5'-nucleotidase family)